MNFWMSSGGDCTVEEIAGLKPSPSPLVEAGRERVDEIEELPDVPVESVEGGVAGRGGAPEDAPAARGGEFHLTCPSSIVMTNDDGQPFTACRDLRGCKGFSVRAYALPDLFAGKIHALLCRRWKNRVSGRDWYDLVWFAANHPRLHLDHLRRRMVQSGHLASGEALTPAGLRERLLEAIDRLDVARARSEVADQVVDPGALAGWSRELFRDVAGRIETV
jgi:hypothetical protein